MAPVRHEEFVAGSSFTNMKMWAYHWKRSLTLDELIGNLYSTSMANPNILGDMKEAFEKNLREELLGVNPEGVYTSEGDIEAILTWK